MIIRRDDFGPVKNLTKGSHKKIWFTCEKCGLGVLQIYKTYIKQNHGKFCRPCRNKHTANRPDVKKKQSIHSKNMWKDSKYREHMDNVLSDAVQKAWDNNPVRKKNLSKNNPMDDPKIRQKQAKNEATPINELIKICNKYNYKFIKRELGYPGTKIIFQCDKGHIQKKRLDAFRTNHWRCNECYKTSNRSQPEEEILKLCEEILPNTKIIPNDRTQIKNPLTNFYLELDMWIPSLNKAIEFNGDYWHKDEYIKTKDKIKQKQCKNKNINLLVIKECDYNTQKHDIINNIKSFLKGKLETFDPNQR